MLSVIRITVIPKRKNRDSVYLKQEIKLKKSFKSCFYNKIYLQIFTNVQFYKPKFEKIVQEISIS